MAASREALLEEVRLLEHLRAGGFRNYLAQHAPKEPPPRHLDPLIAVLDAARMQPVKVCVSMPPEHAKTTTLVRGLAWWIKSSPADTCAFITYGQKKAIAESKRVRSLVRRSGVDTYGTQDDWRTPYGGGLFSGGVGQIGGRRVHGLFVYDDPYKTRDQAESRAYNEKLWDDFNDIVLTRGIGTGASIIVLHSRWTRNDLIGRIRAELKWPWINLPALAEQDDVLGRAPGEALWPDRITREWLANNQARENAWRFASQFQGNPRARGATLFKDAHYYDPRERLPEPHRLSLYVDSAGSQKKSADFSAMVLLAMYGAGANQKAYVLNVYRRQVPVPQFVRDLRDWQLRYGGIKARIDGNTVGDKAIGQMLLEIDKTLQLEENVPIGDKYTRAQPVATAWNDGRVLVPRPDVGHSVPWLHEFLTEVQAFTGIEGRDDHDDQVDCLSGAWNSGKFEPPPPPRIDPRAAMRHR